MVALSVLDDAVVRGLDGRIVSHTHTTSFKNSGAAISDILTGKSSGDGKAVSDYG
jgi:hypothetical protein